MRSDARRCLWRHRLLDFRLEQRRLEQRRAAQAPERRSGRGSSLWRTRNVLNLEGETLSNTVADIYQLPSSDFHDITTGSTGVYRAKVGFDQTTGRGTPIANLLVNGLAHSEWLPPPPGPTQPGESIGINPTPPAKALVATVTPTTTPTTNAATSTTTKASIANVVASPLVSPAVHVAGPTTLHASDAADQLFEAMFGGP